MTQQTTITVNSTDDGTTTTTDSVKTTVDLSQTCLTDLPKYDSVDDTVRSQWSNDMAKRIKATSECFYEITKGDVSLDVSVDTLARIAETAGARTRILRTRTNPEGKEVTEVLVRRVDPADTPLEVRIAAVGNVDSGKSTLLGVLSSGSLDDGRGSARATVFHHAHERLTGRTSSIGHQHIAYDLEGNQVPQDKKTGTASRGASKCVELLDLAGHAKYLKTTLFGMTGHHPDYAMLVVGANMGFIGMTKEHLGITLALKMPAMLVVTKIDMCPPNVLADTMAQIKRITKTPGCRKLPFIVRNMDDVVVCARNFASEKLLPIFCVSNVTGENINLLHAFLNLAPSTHNWGELADAPLQVDVDYDWTISGVGTVLSGTVVSGKIDTRCPLVIGPDSLGKFLPLTVRNIRTRTGDTDHAQAGQSITLAVRRIARNTVRKGMVIVPADSAITPCKMFQAEVLVLYHSTTISPGYECVVHCNAVKQCARVVSMDKPILRSGDKALVTFSFMYQPEVMLKNARVIFRDGHAKGIGRVISITPYVSPTDAAATNTTPGRISITKKLTKAKTKHPKKVPS